MKISFLLLFVIFGVLFTGCADYGIYLETEDKILEIPDHQATRLSYRADSYLYLPFGAIEDDGYVTFRTSLKQGGPRGSEFRYYKDFSAISWCYSKDYSSMLVVIDYWKTDEKGDEIAMREAVHISQNNIQSLSVGERDSFDVTLFSQYSGYGVGPLSQITRKQFPSVPDDFKSGKMEQVYLAYEIYERSAKTFQQGHIIDFSQLNTYANQVKRVPAKLVAKEVEEDEDESSSSSSSSTSSSTSSSNNDSSAIPMNTPSRKNVAPRSSPSRSSESDYEEEEEEDWNPDEYDDNGYRKYKPYY